MPVIIHRILTIKQCSRVSALRGTLRCKADHTHRTNVRRQDITSDDVPLPLGSSTYPTKGVEDNGAAVPSKVDVFATGASTEYLMQKQKNIEVLKGIKASILLHHENTNISKGCEPFEQRYINTKCEGIHDGIRDSRNTLRFICSWFSYQCHNRFLCIAIQCKQRRAMILDSARAVVLVTSNALENIANLVKLVRTTAWWHLGANQARPVSILSV